MIDSAANIDTRLEVRKQLPLLTIEEFAAQREQGSAEPQELAATSLAIEDEGTEPPFREEPDATGASAIDQASMTDAEPIARAMPSNLVGPQPVIIEIETIEEPLTEGADPDLHAAA